MSPAIFGHKLLVIFLYLDSRKISAKGVTRASREQLTHQKYKDALYLSSTLRTPNNRIVSDCHALQTVSIIKLSLSPFDDKRFILEGGIKTLPYGHADAIEATDLENDPEWDVPTQDENEDLFGEEWETDKDSDSTLPASNKRWQSLDLFIESWEPPDPGLNKIINESELDCEDNVDFEAVIDKESPINCPFIDYEAVESEDGREIINSEEEEAIPPRKRGRRTKKQQFSALILPL